MIDQPDRLREARPKANSLHHYTDRRGRNLCDICDKWIGSPAHVAAPAPDRAVVCLGHCGSLDWTLSEYGVITHKHGCPRRTTTFCQSHRDGCPDAPDLLAAVEATERLPEDAPDTEPRATWYEEGWTDRGDAIRLTLDIESRSAPASREAEE